MRKICYTAEKQDQQNEEEYLIQDYEYQQDHDSSVV
jgi:hypothetical protein